MNVKSNMPHVFSPFVLPFRLFVYMMAFILNSSTIWTSLNWHNLGKWHVRVSLYVFVLRLNVCLKCVSVCVCVCPCPCARAKKECREKGFQHMYKMCKQTYMMCFVLFFLFCFWYHDGMAWIGVLCCVCDLLCFSPSLPWLYTKTVAYMHSLLNSYTNLAT